MSLRLLRVMASHIEMPVTFRVRRNRKFPLRRCAVLLSISMCILLVGVIVLAMSFSTSVVVGKSLQSIETKTYVNIEAPGIGNREARVSFEVVRPNVTVSSTTVSSSTTTTTVVVRRFMVWNPDSSGGVRYVYNDDDDLGACASGGLKR